MGIPRLVFPHHRRNPGSRFSKTKRKRKKSGNKKKEDERQACALPGKHLAQNTKQQIDQLDLGEYLRGARYEQSIKQVDTSILQKESKCIGGATWSPGFLSLRPRRKECQDLLDRRRHGRQDCPRGSRGLLTNQLAQLKARIHPMDP